jgi:hypothetical protein
MLRLAGGNVFWRLVGRGVLGRYGPASDNEGSSVCRRPHHGPRQHHEPATEAEPATCGHDDHNDPALGGSMSTSSSWPSRAPSAVVIGTPSRARVVNTGGEWRECATASDETAGRTRGAVMGGSRGMGARTGPSTSSPPTNAPALMRVTHVCMVALPSQEAWTVYPADHACRELLLGAGLLPLPTTCQDGREPVRSVAHGTRG